MLRRRISTVLEQWKAKPNHLPLVIMGIRQCGKTFIAQHFANENYEHVVYINFFKEEERKVAFYTRCTYYERYTTEEEQKRWPRAMVG